MEAVDLTEKNDIFNEGLDDEALTAGIERLARGYHSTRFANPGREDCPQVDLLVEIAGSGEFPDAEMQKHILNCSPCFNDFRMFRMEMRPAVRPEKMYERHRAAFRFPKFAYSASLFAVLLAAVIFLAWRPDKKPELALETPSAAFKTPFLNAMQADNTISLRSDPIGGNTRSKRILKNRPNAQPVLRSSNDHRNIFVDLSKTAILRDDASSESVTPARPDLVTFAFKLRDRSPKGDYEVVLRDTFGNELEMKKAVSGNGKDLRIGFDLTDRHGRVRVCVATAGEIPDCVPVEIRK